VNNIHNVCAGLVFEQKYFAGILDSVLLRIQKNKGTNVPAPLKMRGHFQKLWDLLCHKNIKYLIKCYEKSLSQLD
jgi:hypothetical protein